MAGFPALGSFAGLEADQPYAGIQRRSFSSQGATVTSYEFEPGARFPMHRHDQEQITIVDRGDVEFTVDGVSQALREGDWSIVPGDMEHGLLAGASGARILAIIVPRRQDADDMALVDAT
jgi:quercetin dioxygenase-like cupin family protein